MRIATDNDEEGAGFAVIIEGLVAEMGKGTWRSRGLSRSMPRTGTMRFCVQAGWFLKSVDSIPWYVLHSPRAHQPVKSKPQGIER